MLFLWLVIVFGALLVWLGRTTDGTRNETGGLARCQAGPAEPAALLALNIVVLAIVTRELE